MTGSVDQSVQFLFDEYCPALSTDGRVRRLLEEEIVSVYKTKGKVPPSLREPSV
jgi:hypothetical protein